MGAICVAVAKDAGPRFPDILDQPWALTLWTYYQLAERERIHALIERIESVNDATLTALAFNDPKKLEGESKAARDACSELPHGRDEQSEAEWKARAARLVAALEEGRVLEGDVPVTHA